MAEIVSVYSNKKDYVTMPHDHEVFMFLMPQRGIMKFKNEERDWSTAIAPRQFVVVPPEQGHSTSAMISDQSHFAFYADSDTVGRAIAGLTGGRGSRRVFAGGVWGISEPLHYLTLTRKKLAKPSPHLDRQSQLSHTDNLLLLESVAVMLSKPSVSRSSVERHAAALVKWVKTYLNDALDHVPPLDMLAANFNISKRHLTRVFAEETGETVLRYVQRLRVARSKELLIHTRLSVVEIAQTVGFQSASHFADIFRRHTDVSPDQWRRGRVGDPPAN